MATLSQPAGGRPCGRAPTTGGAARHAGAVPDHLTDLRLPRRLLRLEVGRLRAAESRRVFDASVHVGRLGGERAGFVLRAQDRLAMDQGLRIDVICRLLDDTDADDHTAWLVRPGTPEPQDQDLRWHAAARTAFGVHGRALDGCFVLTRTGWRDAMTGEQQVWARLRLP
jgi:hypothetical protein